MENTVNIGIFIIDDDADLLEVVKQTIEKAGITNYELFTDEQKFLNGLDEEIHVVVTDHRLIKLTGLDIVREVKNKNDGSFVIGYSGMKDPSILIEYINNDIDRFVDKNKPNHLEMLTTFLNDGVIVAKRRIDFMDYIKKESLKYAN